MQLPGKEDLEMFLLPLAGFWAIFDSLSKAIESVNRMRETILIGQMDGKKLTLEHRSTLLAGPAASDRHTVDRRAVRRKWRDEWLRGFLWLTWGDSFEDFGQRPADAAQDRFRSEDDSRANVQVGEEGRKRLAL